MTKPEGQQETLERLLLELLPPNGTAVGNAALLERWTEAANAAGIVVESDTFATLREDLVARGLVVKGKGRGGSTARSAAGAGTSDNFSLTADRPLPTDTAAAVATPRQAKARMPKAKPADADQPAQVLSYRHADKRKNNPEVGLVNEASDPQQPKKEWAYNPHLDPVLNFDSARAELENLIDDALAAGSDRVQQQIGEIVAWLDHALAGSNEAAVREVVGNLRQRLTAKAPPPPERTALEEIKRRGAPYLQWSGKAERTSFEVDTVSLHVHERIDPMSILSAVRRRLEEVTGKKGKAEDPSALGRQASLFEAPFESLPFRDAVDFYRHDKGWANRLIAGDSLLVMNSLLVKEGMAGQVQMIYIDPPYGIKYGSNFQPFVGKRDVKDRSDADLTQEPEMIKAFRDTWELGLHSYLTYLRDRLLLACELLSESGSAFVQISEENLHHTRELLDEVMGASNFVGLITFKKTTGAGSPSGGTEVLASISDYILWYAKDRTAVKYRQLYREKSAGGAGTGQYTFIELPNGERRRQSSGEDVDEARIRRFRGDQLTSQSSGGPQLFPFDLNGREFQPKVSGWKTNQGGMRRLLQSRRVISQGDTPSYVRYIDDFPAFPHSNLWDDTVTSGFGDAKVYVVQTNAKVIEAPRRFVWNPTPTIAGRSRARWACGQAAFGPVHMSTGRLFNGSGVRS